MRIKVLLITVITLVLSAVHLKAQESKSITGVVKDGEGLTMPGVNITIKGSTNGTVTDSDGNFTLEAKKGDVLVFTFVGYEDQELTVGNQTVINVVLTTDGKALKEVVVTALGISREKESLGYSTQEVTGEELNKVPTPNFINSISGKASGVQVRRNNNFGGSSNVVIRGNASLLGNNQALFVIDGVPIDNTNSNGDTQKQARRGYDYGNPASDINPDDIESINILKGAAAAALYGSRAANGVVLIKTKKGGGVSTSNQKPRVGVTYSTGYTFGVIDKSTFPEYQNEYGAGYGKSYGADGKGYFDQQDLAIENALTKDDTYENIVPFREDASYGGKFDNQLVYQYDAFVKGNPNYGKATPWKVAENGPISFFNTPTTLTNSLSFGKATEFGSVRFNYSNFVQHGLMPNSRLDRNNFSFAATGKLTNKLTLNTFSNYIKTDGFGRNSTGYGGNLMSMFRQWWQTNVDLKQQKEMYEMNKENVTWNRISASISNPIYWDNPYFNRNESYQTDERSRYLGYASLNLEIYDWVSAFGRIAIDTYDALQEERLAKGSTSAEFGVGKGTDGSFQRSEVTSGYSRKNIASKEINYDFMLNFNKKLTDDFDISGILGTNLRESFYNSVFSSTNGGLVIPSIYAISNTASTVLPSVEQIRNIQIFGLYGSASFGYRDMIYLDLTLRNDTSSTLPVANNSFYYPSVSASFVFTKLVEPTVPALSFGKLRANYASVGNSASFARTTDYYILNPAFGTASMSALPTSKNNPNLKPEITTSLEFGLEMNFFKSRVGFDVSYYSNIATNQLLSLPVSRTTGYSSVFVNTGEIQNNGIEIALNSTPIIINHFQWNLSVNWSANRNKVVSLYTDESGNPIKNLQLGSLQGGVTINAEIGQPYGVIKGRDYVYKNGQKVVDPSNGRYLRTDTSDNPIGNMNPDWNMGVTNTFSYKNIALSFLVDIQQGGDIYSLDMYYGLGTGLYKETVFNNDLGNPVRDPIESTEDTTDEKLGGGAINEGVTPDGEKNTKRISHTGAGSLGWVALPSKAFVYDASYIKLRELTVSYQIPRTLLKNIFFTDATVSFVGSNLWIIHKNLPHADPESGMSSGNIQGYSVGSLPTTRQFGFNLKIEF